MANVEKQRKRLIKLLKELFQLDQPDLDFGFYKIMHAKADTISSFLEKDLLGIIQNAFGEADEAKVEKALLEYETMKRDAEELGAPNPEEAPKVKKAKAVYDAAKDSGSNEGDVYEHLYRFFERYYDSGDFMSRRYFARETDGKAAPYSVPYDGREVYLHWANRDQYYIKTSEYLTNFTFDIARHFSTPERATYKIPDSLKMHCRIIEAAEGDHNNVKTSDNSERFFIIHEDEPIIMEDDELVIQFEYRPDPSKAGQASIWQRKLIDTAEEKILDALTGLSAASIYNETLRTQIGEDKNKRLLLRKYLNQYSARNTMDYFIHKDLGGFLRRELDFYIKNEIMRLDDIEDADAPQVESYLIKIKVLRKIAVELVTFLTQLEEFQKKIWLKKKFVTDTNYCITLDRIPESYYPKIVANDKQREEWVKLFAIDDIESDLAVLGYSEPLTTNFLKENPFLVLDTAFFKEDFKNNLLAEIQHLDENIDGLMVHSENFQALQLMPAKYSKTIDGIYIDPPYNTNATEFIYKNGYKHSSWASLMSNRLQASVKLLSSTAVTCTTIDDYEVANLSQIIKATFENHELRPVIIEYNHRGRVKSNFATTHEYALWSIPHGQDLITRQKDISDDIKRNLRRTGTGSKRHEAPSQFYGIEVDNNSLEILLITDALPVNAEIPEHQNSNTTMVWPIDDEGVQRRWYYGRDRILPESKENTVWAKKIKGKIQIHYWQAGKPKRRKSVWVGPDLDASTFGSELLNDYFGIRDFDFPKSIHAVKKCIGSMSNSKQSLFLDYFSGSGTTGHAIIDLNREDDGSRKYILVEMGNHFDDVTKPRIQKAIHSKDWKNGKPISRGGISHAFKYIRLESYEDALNNLAFQDNEKRVQALAGNNGFRREYMLKYWIDFETRDSPSLLNIDRFSDPSCYVLKIKKPGSDEYEEKNIDLIETFNWLIGLHVDHIDVWRIYDGTFKREDDPELPKDKNTKLILDGTMKEDTSGEYHFRKIEGRVCATPGDKTNMESTLVIWRKMTDDIEADNLMLDEWFKKYRLSTQDSEFDVIYVNGSNNLSNLRHDSETWKVRLIEESFHQKMWDVGR